MKLQTPISPYTIPGIRPEDRPIWERRLFGKRQNGRMPEALELVCQHFGLTKEQIFEHNRTFVRCMARKFFTLMCRDYFKLPLAVIGQFIGRDHTTIIHCNQSLRDEMEFDSQLRNEFQSLAAKLF